VIITSASNQRLKKLRQVLRVGQGDENAPVPVEGLKLLREAIKSRLQIEELFVSSHCRSEAEALLNQVAGNLPEIIEVADKVFPSISSTETPQGILALAKLPAVDLDRLLRTTAFLLVGEELQDPGNLGTLVRSAEAFGVRGLLLTYGSVDPRNPKVIRSSAGSVFRVPCLTGLSGTLLLEQLSRYRFEIVAATPQGEIDFRDISYQGRLALAVGNEGRGLSEAVLRQATLKIRIPTGPLVESLNVSVATSIIMCEAARQRASEPKT